MEALDSFQYKNYLQTLKLTSEELTRYYTAKRRYEYELGKGPFNSETLPIFITNIFSPIICKLSVLDAKSRGVKIMPLESTKEESKKNLDLAAKSKRPVIYAYTHVGRYDIETAFSIIKGGAYTFMGDPGMTYKNFDGLMLRLKGLDPLDIDAGDKSAPDYELKKEICRRDRNIVFNNTIELLKHGGNVVMCPEGAWNDTPNKIVTHISSGVIRMAALSNALILPIGICSYGLDYYYNVGKLVSVEEITFDKGTGLYDEKSKAIIKLEAEELEATLGGLKYDIMEQNTIKRSELSSNAYQEYIDSIMKYTENGYDSEAIARTRFDQDKLPSTFVSDEIGKLNPNKNNSFLFEGRDRLSVIQGLKSAEKILETTEKSKKLILTR